MQPTYHIHAPVRKDKAPILTTFGPLTCQPSSMPANNCQMGTLYGVTLDEMQSILGESQDENCDPCKMGYAFFGVIFVRSGNFRAFSVGLWDWKGSSERGAWSVWAGGGMYEVEAWKAYLLGALAVLQAPDPKLAELATK